MVVNDARFAVDIISGVIAVGADDISPMPPGSGAGLDGLATGFARGPERILGVLDTRRIVGAS